MPSSTTITTITTSTMSQLMIIVSLALVATLFYVPNVEACSCIPHNRHGPPVYCRTRFLAAVRIDGVAVTEVTKHYNYTLVKDFGAARPHINNSLALKHTGVIDTSKDSAACGVDLQVDSTYLLGGGGPDAGGNPTIFLCNYYARPWAVNADDVAQMIKRC